MSMYTQVRFAFAVTMSTLVLGGTAIAQTSNSSGPSNPSNAQMSWVSERVELMSMASNRSRDDRSGTADSLFERAKAAYKVGDYAKACELATQAHDITAGDRTTAGTRQDIFFADKMAEYCDAAKA